MRKVVVNTTPLIALSKCGCLDILHSMYGEVMIPEAVYKEIYVKNDSVSADVNECADWIKVVSISSKEDKCLYRARLHDGEVEVMILAQELHADTVIIDDLAARSTADYLKLPLTGTLGVLIKAKRCGYIKSVMDIVKKMEENHIYYSEALKTLIREKSGETE